MPVPPGLRFKESSSSVEEEEEGGEVTRTVLSATLGHSRSGSTGSRGRGSTNG